MNYSQIAILFLQAILIAFTILLLFRLRKKLGIGPLFACLGLFQFVQVFLSSTVYLSITNNLLVSPGSSVFFTGTLFAILIIYIKEDASETKRIIYALFIVNLIMAILLQTFGWNLKEVTTYNPLNLPTTLFDISAKVIFVGGIALILDAILIISIFEFISRHIKSLFFQIMLTMLIVVSFDTVFFSIITFWDFEKLKSIVISGLISKGIFAVFYSFIFYFYLKYKDSEGLLNQLFKVSDVFQPLTYKQKFKDVSQGIKKAEEMYRLLADNSSDLICLHEKDSTFKYISPSVKEMLGYEDSELVGTLGFDLIYKEDVAFFEDSIKQRVLNKVSNDTFVCRALHKKGHLKWLEFTASVVYLDDKINYILTSARDVTERILAEKEIEKALAKLEKSESSKNDASRLAKIGYLEDDIKNESRIWSESLYNIFGFDTEKELKDEEIMTFFDEESQIKLIESGQELDTNGTPFDIELKASNVKKEEIWLRALVFPVYNSEKEIVGRRGVIQDITDQKIKQQELDLKNQQLYELNKALNLAQKLSQVGNWHWNMVTDEAEWSDEMYNIYGVNKEDFYPSNANVTKTVSPEDLHKIEKGVSSLLVDNMFVPFEFRIKRPSGEIRTLYIQALEKKSDDSIFGVTKDITERIKIEEERLRIKDNYERLFDNATVSIWNEDFSFFIEAINDLKKLNISDIDSYLEQNSDVLFSLLEKITVNKVNKATLKLFEAKSNKSFINNVPITFGKGASKVFRDFVIAAWNNEKSFTSEINYKTLKGVEFAAIVSIPIPQTAAEQKTVPVIIQSIQNLKDAELEKKISIERLKESQEISHIGSWSFNLSNQKSEWSEETFRIWGFDYKKNAPDRDTIINRIHIDDRELFNKAVKLALAKGDPYDIEFRICLPNNVEKTLRSICKPIFDDNGKIITLRGTNQDITEQKLIRSKIEQAEEMYRLLTDNSNDLICLHEVDSSFIYISPSIKNLLGYSQSDFLGKKVYSLVHEEDIEPFKDAMAKELFSNSGSLAYTFRVRHKDGHFVWLEFLTAPVYKENKISFYVTSARDITQWIEAKQEIQEYQTSLQEMTTEMTLIEENQKKEIASNIHDHLSQSLVISKMKISELKKNPQLKIINEDLKFIEENISEALENSRKITYELSPPVLYQLGVIDALNWLLENTETTHQIKCKVNSNVSNVNLDDVKSILLYRSIQEVVKNAVKYANASLLSLNIDKTKSGLDILFKDNGIGFDISTLNNYHNHSGSGFGLFAVQERIKNIQGKFTITSKINVGTSVHIFIPLSE